MTNVSAPHDDPVAVIESPIPGHTDEDLARDLRPEVPPSRAVSVLTKALLVLALVSVGMVGGVLLDRQFGGSASTGPSGNGTLQGGFGGGFGGGTGGPPAGFEPPAGFQPPTGGG